MNSAQYKALIDASPTFDIKRVFLKYVFHWPLFILGIIVCVAGGLAFLKINKPVYVVKASLIISNDKKDPDQKSGLQELDMINTSNAVDNEIEILKSNQLIKRVVNDLQLWVVMTKKDKLSTTDLYTASPFKFSLIKSNGNLNNVSFNVIVKDSKSFYLQYSTGKVKEFPFNKVLESSFGSWQLTPTDSLPRYQDKIIQISLSEPETTASAYQKAIDADFPNKLTSTAVLSIDDRIAERGKDILNQLIYEYNRAGEIEQNSETEKMLSFIDKRIDSLAGGVNAAEAGLEGFKSSRGITDIASDSKNSQDNLQNNSNRLNDVNIQLNIIEGIDRAINSSQDIDKAIATQGINDPTLTDLVNKLSDLQLQRDRLLATSPETNPEFDPINRQISTVKASIRENVKNIKSNLLSTQQKLESYNNKFQSSIRAIPTQERQYGSIKRQQSVKEDLYTYLLQKREELSVKYASELANDQLVDKAYIESFKGPKPSITLAVAFLLGLILPTCLIYVRSSLNDKIYDVNDIKKVLNTPVISQLDYQPSRNSLVINTDGATPLSEQFRSLRSSLNHNLNKKQGKVTLLTSSVSGEGKSFICKNLAVAMAYSGKKTIVLDIDMRRPQIAKLFDINGENVGISDFLNNKATITSIIQKSGLIDELDIISSGKPVPNPSELLERDELNYLLNSLRETYDWIIIDSPPVHLVPDAMVLSRISDITLYVIRQGVTQLAELDFIKELEEQKLLSSTNIIFNGIERLKYGYGYKYTNNSYYSDKSKKGAFHSIFYDFSSRF